MEIPQFQMNTFQNPTNWIQSWSVKDLSMGRTQVIMSYNYFHIIEII